MRKYPRSHPREKIVWIERIWSQIISSVDNIFCLVLPSTWLGNFKGVSSYGSTFYYVEILEPIYYRYEAETVLYLVRDN